MKTKGQLLTKKDFPGTITTERGSDIYLTGNEGYGQTFKFDPNGKTVYLEDSEE
jgi:hypothetical protein